MTGLFGFLKKPEPKGGQIKDTLQNKYFTFQKLLAENNRVLTVMSEMDEKLAAGQVFDRDYLVTTAAGAVESVYKLIEYVNDLSRQHYTHLFEVHARISAELADLLAISTEIPEGPPVLPYSAIGKDMAAIVGHKNAHLGEIGKTLALPCPEGFAISAQAFKRFIDHNRLADRIAALLPSLDIDNPEELATVSRRIQDLVRAAVIPADLLYAIGQAMVDLRARVTGDLDQTAPPRPFFVSVRSSALHEDGDFTFAGQYATFLNVPAEEVSERYKAVIASLFTPKALHYSKTRGFQEADMVMAVGVMRMVDARAGGVMYTRDPNDRDSRTIVINAAWGLGMRVVEGGTTQAFMVGRDPDSVIARRIPVQTTMLACGPAGDIAEVAVPADRRAMPCLTEDQIRQLAGYGEAIEKYYGYPQDIEWAAEQDGRLVILQCRPLHIRANDPASPKVPARLANHRILLDQGVIACKGIAHGPAFVLRDEEELNDFPLGAVLVARNTDTKFVTVMSRAAAIVTDVGGVAGHMSSLAREYDVPTILDTGLATKVIEHGDELTVDAVNCLVYAGRAEELLDPLTLENHAGRNLFRDTRLYKTLEKVHALIAPLNLVDPDLDDFRPEGCRTLHDITRFIHEKAMTEVIFMSGRTQEVKNFEDLMCAITFAEAGEAKGLKEQTSNLHAGIPMEAHVLDIDQGLKCHRRKVALDDIASVPFHPFVKGLMDMRWPDVKPPAAQGLRGMLATSAVRSGETLEKVTSNKSYAIISRYYMNFSLKLGYHFSMVEAYACENLNDNYIKFFFKGGGASPDRKLRRVRLISRIMKKMDFRVTITDDVVNAMLTKFKLPDMEKRLELMGRLTVYTKQLDMAMFNDAVTDMFVDDFVKAYMKGL